MDIVGPVAVATNFITDYKLLITTSLDKDDIDSRVASIEIVTSVWTLAIQPIPILVPPPRSTPGFYHIE